MDRTEATNIELWGLYNVLRSSYLNVLYYGARATFWSRWNLWLQVVASIGSLGAVGVFLAAGTEAAHPHEIGWKIVAALIGMVSASSAAIPVAMGHAGKINSFERLHFAYCELFQLTQKAVMDIRRKGLVSDEQRSAAKLLEDLYSRLGQHDDPDHKDKLHDRCIAAVNAKYPKDSLWYASGDGNQETVAGT